MFRSPRLFNTSLSFCTDILFLRTEKGSDSSALAERMGLVRADKRVGLAEMNIGDRVKIPSWDTCIRRSCELIKSRTMDFSSIELEMT